MLTAVTVLGLGLVGVSPPPAVAEPVPAGEWPQFRGGPARNGSDLGSLITPANVSTLAQAWHADIGGVTSSPAVVNGVVYVGGAAGNIYAFPASCASGPSCPPLWTGTAGPVASSPAVAGGVVYVGSLDGKLYAFDAAGVQGCSGTPVTCAPLWTATTGGDINSSPVVGGGKVYVGSADDSLYAFDAAGVTNCTGTPKSCTPLWTRATGGDVYGSPAVAAGVVYAGSDDHKVYAFDAAAGTPRWTATTGGLVQSSPAVVNGVVYVGSFDTKLYAFDAAGVTNCSGSPKTCAPLWTAATGGIVFSSPAVANGVVYVAAWDQKLSAFDAAGVTNCSGAPKTCTPMWTAVVSTVNLALTIATPAVAGGLVYIGTGVGDTKIHAFDAAGATNCTGTRKVCTPVWTGDTGASVRSSAAVAGGRLYVGTDGNGLRAFAADTVPGDGAFHPQAPARIFDSRTTGGAFAPNTTRSITMTGRAGIPATGVSSVVLNVTVTEPSAGGWLTVFPSGATRPLASSINFSPGHTIANAVVVKVGTDGAIDVYNFQGSTHVVLDVQGWFGSAIADAGARYTSVAPSRILDTRSTTPISPGGTRSLAVAGQGGVPATGATAVVLNVTVTDPTAGGWLTVSPTGVARPLASNINFAPGQTVANKVIARLGAGGSVDIYNFVGNTQVVVDVEGWFGVAGGPEGVPYHPLVPARVADTRSAGAVGPNGTLSLVVTGPGGVPGAGVTAVLLNVTVTEPSAGGWLTVFPAGTTRPLASSINFAPGQTIANAVVAKVGAGGQINIYNFGGNTHVIVDVQGWFG